MDFLKVLVGFILVASEEVVVVDRGKASVIKGDLTQLNR
jgi:hypothetical protein